MRPTQSLLGLKRRLRLTTKMAGKGYYKGTGSGSMGRHDKHGGYKIDWNKVRTYVVPRQPIGYDLKPFVSKNVPDPRDEPKPKPARSSKLQQRGRVVDQIRTQEQETLTQSQHERDELIAEKQELRQFDNLSRASGAQEQLREVDAQIQEQQRTERGPQTHLN